MVPVHYCALVNVNNIYLETVDGTFFPDQPLSSHDASHWVNFKPVYRLASADIFKQLSRKGDCFDSQIMEIFYADSAESLAERKLDRL